jgi:hypothetical protein
MIAYAVAYQQAAELIARSSNWTDNHGLIVPFFGLIGFALENAMKALLEHRLVEPKKDWFHSHDLKQLRDLVSKEGLSVSSDANAFIDGFAIHHKEHHFRYPQKARHAELMKPPTVVILTDVVLRMILYAYPWEFRKPGWQVPRR